MTRFLSTFALGLCEQSSALRHLSAILRPISPRIIRAAQSCESFAPTSNLSASTAARRARMSPALRLHANGSNRRGGIVSASVACRSALGGEPRSCAIHAAWGSFPLRQGDEIIRNWRFTMSSYQAWGMISRGVSVTERHGSVRAPRHHDDNHRLKPAARDEARRSGLAEQPRRLNH